MGFFGKRKTEETLSYCEYDEININRYAISRSNSMRKIQLSALFVMLKNEYKDAEYTIKTSIKEFYIPEEFEQTEIMAISKYFEVKEWNIFIDEEHYVDIDFDFVKVNGEIEMIDKCKELLKKAESYKSDIEIATFNFNKYSGWLWDKYIESQYITCINMGNRYLKYGDFFIYDSELDEYKICSKEDFDKCRDKNIILLKSKLDKYKVVIIDMQLRQVIATELDDLEKEYLSNILKPEIDE